MLKQFSVLLKKDIHFIVQSKFYLVLIGSLLLYSFYINFVYVNTDIGNYPVYVYDQTGGQFALNAENINPVADEQELYKRLHSNSEAVGVLAGPNDAKIIISQSGSERLDYLKQLYAQYLIQDYSSDFLTQIISSDNFELKKRIEMVSVIVFFEITTISFLGIAALFFKEKEMGVLKVYGILPSSKLLFVLSKLIIFLVMEIIFVTVMSLINLGLGYSIIIYFNVLLQILILSPIMVLLGFLFSLIYKNFKQFGFAYTVIIITLTSPVFLFVNTSLEWSGIRYFPTYYLYNNLNKAYFNNINYSSLYYAICGLIVGLLYFIDIKMISRELKRG